MNHKSDHEMKLEAIDRILATEDELVPSQGFLAAAMDRIREEAATPPPCIEWQASRVRESLRTAH